MTPEIITFVLVLLINLALAVSYLLWHLLRKKEKQRSCWISFWVMLLCPVAAVLFFFFGWLLRRIFFHRPVDLEDVIFSKERVRNRVKADVETERNLVPLEEAIAVTDKAGTRSLMLEVARRDISDALSTIALSLRSSDSEVSHYGAAVLQSALNDFRNRVQILWHMIQDGERQEQEQTGKLSQDEQAPEGGKLSQKGQEPETGNRPQKEQRPEGGKLSQKGQEPETGNRPQKEQAPEDGELIRSEQELVEDLDSVLRQHILPPIEQETYVSWMEQSAGYLKARSSLTADLLEKLCCRLLEIGEYEKTRKWASLSMELFPHVLSSYTNLMRLALRTGDRETFFSVMEELKKSRIPADHQTLEVLRLFQT